MGRLAWTAAVALTVVLSGEPSSAQDQGIGQEVRVFLDCQGPGCDFDLTRREITWVTWVRDREDADVHLLVRFTPSGSGFTYLRGLCSRIDLGSQLRITRNFAYRTTRCTKRNRANVAADVRSLGYILRRCESLCRPIHFPEKLRVREVRPVAGHRNASLSSS